MRATRRAQSSACRAYFQRTPRGEKKDGSFDVGLPDAVGRVEKEWEDRLRVFVQCSGDLNEGGVGNAEASAHRRGGGDGMRPPTAAFDRRHGAVVKAVAREYGYQLRLTVRVW